MLRFARQTSQTHLAVRTAPLIQTASAAVSFLAHALASRSSGHHASNSQNAVPKALHSISAALTAPACTAASLSSSPGTLNTSSTRRPISPMEFARCMEKYDLTPGGHIAVAVSGGADSLALAFLTKEYCSSRHLSLTAIILDHHVRIDSSAEAQAVSTYLAACGFNTKMLKLAWKDEAAPDTRKSAEGDGNDDVNSDYVADDGMAASSSSTVADSAQTPLLPPSRPRRSKAQETLREGRYSSLVSAALDVGAEAVLVGHHLDDNIETFLLRLFRGSGMVGLRGIEDNVPHFHPATWHTSTLHPSSTSSRQHPTSSTASFHARKQQSAFLSHSYPPIVRVLRPLLPFPKERLQATCISFTTSPSTATSLTMTPPPSPVPLSAASDDNAALSDRLATFPAQPSIPTLKAQLLQQQRQQQRQVTEPLQAAFLTEKAETKLVHQSGPWVEDPSNRDEVYDRVRVRQTLAALYTQQQQQQQQQQELQLQKEQHKELNGPYLSLTREMLCAAIEEASQTASFLHTASTTLLRSVGVVQEPLGIVYLDVGRLQREVRALLRQRATIGSSDANVETCATGGDGSNGSDAADPGTVEDSEHVLYKELVMLCVGRALAVVANKAILPSNASVATLLSFFDPHWDRSSSSSLPSTTSPSISSSPTLSENYHTTSRAPRSKRSTSAVPGARLLHGCRVSSVREFDTPAVRENRSRSAGTRDCNVLLIRPNEDREQCDRPLQPLTVPFSRTSVANNESDALSPSPSPSASSYDVLFDRYWVRFRQASHTLTDQITTLGGAADSFVDFGRMRHCAHHTAGGSNNNSSNNNSNNNNNSCSAVRPPSPPRVSQLWERVAINAMEAAKNPRRNNKKDINTSTGVNSRHERSQAHVRRDDAKSLLRLLPGLFLRHLALPVIVHNHNDEQGVRHGGGQEGEVMYTPFQFTTSASTSTSTRSSTEKRERGRGGLEKGGVEIKFFPAAAFRWVWWHDV